MEMSGADFSRDLLQLAGSAARAGRTHQGAHLLFLPTHTAMPGADVGYRRCAMPGTDGRHQHFATPSADVADGNRCLRLR
eukprot:1746134-Rhodomonas_salina.1